MISMIACMARNRVIGKDNQMPWHLPEDLKFFKRTTLGYPVVMGRSTYESIGQALPGRENIILTRDRRFTADQCRVVHSVEDVLQLKKDLFIIGGAATYEQFMPYADRLYITIIDQDFEGDTFFPYIDPEEWQLVEQVPGSKNEKNPYDYTFNTFERK
jgi:dihydrofolate reductase